jgi:chaperonin GroES
MKTSKSRAGSLFPIPLRKPQEAEVVALGTGKKDDDGNVIPFQVKKGDKVLISKYGGTEVKLDDVEYQLVREDDILGVVG